MCGLTGIFEYRRPTEISKDLVHRMNETIVHRGPDDEGIFVGPGIGLGFRRLSIIDLSGGHQPIANEDGSIWVMLNGEIYNYPELRKEMLEKGHTLATRSDTETIVHLYEEYGEDCFAQLRGMFAVVIWDSNKRKLLMARDRLGKKPLFYSADSQRVLFGSELKALLAGDNLSREMDPYALYDYFSFGYIPAPKTVYSSVRKVLPGHHITVSGDGVLREKSYWKLSFGETDEHSEADWCERLHHELCEATRIRLMSDVPLGAFLSGGLDSSAVVATMARLMNQPVTTCSIGFDVPEFDESKYARQVAEQFHTQHHEQVVQPDALTVVDKLAWHYDEPFADSSAIPTYYVSGIARKYVTVALGGDGGDENFAGYRRYQFDVMENRIRARVPAGIRSSIFGPLGRWYPPLAWAPRVFRAKATFQSLSRNPLEGYFNSISIFRPGEKSKLFQRDFLDQLAGYDSIEVLRHHYDRADTEDPLSRIQYVDIKTYLPDDILTKVDRASMAVSLEVRAPLLDHRLTEMAARMPSSLKLRGREGKYIFKKAMEPTLSRDILYRSKQGFAVPLAHWFRNELKEMAHETIFGVKDGILVPQYLQKIWTEHQRGTFDRSAHLWAVLMFRKWQKGWSRVDK
jgi:asparagine synthase (glutamine-hydrolysing)